MMNRRVWCFLAVLLVSFTVGCGGSKATVSGTVTLDGAPLEKGQIQFIPTAPEAQLVVAEIVAGKYSATTVPGEMKVQVLATKVVGQRPAFAGDPNSQMIEDVVSIVAPQYNINTTLKVDLKGGANSDVNFSITSK